MKIYGMEKLSLVDFDGKITCTIFLGGCNFRCPFCHNSSLVLNPSINQEIDIKTVTDYLELRKNMIDAVCLTGGEPTLYSDIIEFFRTIKNMGYITKLDTNGSNPEMIKKLCEEGLVDYVAMDIKNSLNKYQKTIGVNNKSLIDNVKESIKYIINSGIDYEFRTTLVKEFHTMDDILEIREMLSGAKRYYLQKFVDNDNCIVNGLHEIDIEEAKKFLKLLQEKITNTSLRGY